MLTSEWCADHASHTEVVLIILPQLQQLVNGGLLLRDTVEPRYKAWLKNHCRGIKVCCQPKKNGKHQVEQEMGLELVMRKDCLGEHKK